MDVLWKENNIFYNILGFLITENEKLFNRSDAKLYWRTVLHIYTIFHYTYVGLFGIGLSVELQNSANLSIKALYTYRFGFLTGWNVLFQTVFLFLALAHDILEWLDKHHTAIGSKLRYWRDVLFCALVIPFTCFVFGMFWLLYAIDRELVFPKVYDEVIPWWFNQCVHTNIMVMIVVETLLQARRYPTNLKLELIMNTTVGILYAIVYYSIYFFANRWLYNVFGIMTWWQVCLFQICIWSACYIFYKIQFPINRLVHGSEPKMEKTQQNSEFLGRNGEDTNKNGDSVHKNGELIEKNGKNSSQNGEVPEKNGEVVYKNGEFPHENGDVRDNDEQSIKDEEEIKNGNSLPFATKSWSLKYRTMRNESDNSSL